MRSWTRTRSQRFRTLARLLFDFAVGDPTIIPIYQLIAPEAVPMHARGMRISAIAKHFGVDHHTAEKALRWFRSR